LRLLLPLIIALLAACTSRTDVVLPIAPAIVGNSRVEAVALDIRPSARASIAALDEAARGREGAAGQAVAELLPNAIKDTAQAAGLTGGRPLRVLVELDHFQVASTGSALFGGEDRLAGTVFLRDAGTGQPLGQLYIDVNARTSGVMALATRGGVRERMAYAFADRVARALRGR
jgi:hypothetical protein